MLRLLLELIVREYVENTKDNLLTEYYLSEDGKTVIKLPDNTAVNIIANFNEIQ